MHQQKTLSRLTGGLGKSVKKENLWRKYFFSDIVEWSSKYFWKIIPADAKANENKRNKRCDGSILQILSTFWKYLQNLKYNVKKVYIFHLVLVVILSILILSIKKRGDSPFMEFPGLCKK